MMTCEMPLYVVIVIIFSAAAQGYFQKLILTTSTKQFMANNVNIWNLVCFWVSDNRGFYGKHPKPRRAECPLCRRSCKGRNRLVEGKGSGSSSTGFTHVMHRKDQEDSSWRLPRGGVKAAVLEKRSNFFRYGPPMFIRVLAKMEFPKTAPSYQIATVFSKKVLFQRLLLTSKHNKLFYNLKIL